MPQYLNSSNVKMFPSAYRGQNVDAEAYFTTEGNLTKSDVLGFYHKSFIEDLGSGNLVIVIEGYRFDVSMSSIISLFSSDSEVYADIKTLNKGSDGTFKTLVSYSDSGTILDDGTYFKGLAFATTISELSARAIKVLEKVEGTWRVPNTSKLNIVANQIMTGDSGQDVNTSIREKIVTSELQAINVSSGTLGASGNLTVDGDISGDSNLTINGTTSLKNATITGTLGVTSNEIVGGTLDVTSNASIGGTTSSTGKITGGNGLEITSGSTSLKDTSVDGTLNVSSGVFVDSLDVSNNVSILGQLNVTGNTTLKANVNLTNIKTSSGVAGLQIDSNGKVDKVDNSSSYTRTIDSANDVKVLSAYNQNSTGKISSTSETSLPLASDSQAGLVASNQAQTFSGIKTFKDGLTSSLQYGNFTTCSTASNTKNKEITLTNFPANANIPNGACIHVFFNNSNTYSTPSLKINGGDPIDIKFSPLAATRPLWEAGEVVELIFYKVEVSGVTQSYWLISNYRTLVEAASNAGNVASTINGHAINNIFESNGTTVKLATLANRATNANSADVATKVGNSLTITLNGSSSSYDGSTSISRSFYAPNSYGNANTTVLVGNGQNNAPIWKLQYEIESGSLANSNGKLNVGSSSKPVYFSNGVPTTCSNITSGTVELNGKNASVTEICYDSGSQDVETTSVSYSKYNTDAYFYLTYVLIGKILKISLCSFDASLWPQDRYNLFNADYLVKKCLGNAYSLDTSNGAYPSASMTARNRGLAGDGDICSTYRFVKNNITYICLGIDSKGTSTSADAGICAEITLVIA